jgi:hypothetical protein
MVPVHLVDVSLDGLKAINKNIAEMLDYWMQLTEDKEDWEYLYRLFPDYVFQFNREYCVQMLHKLNSYVNDGFHRNYIKPFLRYILFNVVDDFVESRNEFRESGEKFPEDKIVEKWNKIYDDLEKERKDSEFNPDEEYHINNIEGYLDILFEDTDFLMLDKLFINGEPNTNLINILGIDIEEFADLLPDDIRESIEYDEVKTNIENNKALTEEMAKEVLQKLDEIRDILKEKDRKSKWSKLVKILIWLADKSVDVALMLSPIISRGMWTL